MWHDDKEYWSVCDICWTNEPGCVLFLAQTSHVSLFYLRKRYDCIYVRIPYICAVECLAFIVSCSWREKRDSMCVHFLMLHCSSLMLSHSPYLVIVNTVSPSDNPVNPLLFDQVYFNLKHHFCVFGCFWPSVKRPENDRKSVGNVLEINRTSIGNHGDIWSCSCSC